jgi:hypothetical protein
VFPDQSVAITGRPASIASAIGRPKPSARCSETRQSADATRLWVSASLRSSSMKRMFGHPAAAPLHAAWAAHGAAIGPKRGLRDTLALDLFGQVHRPMYDNRPIHWPLSSANKTFVAYVNIHRLNENTLRVLQADHLRPTLTRIDGALVDLRAARDGDDKAAARAAEKRLGTMIKARDELVAFLAAVEACADRGPPPPDAKCPPREADARYAPDLDDGVLINAAALYPLLDPQWKDPRKWWVELATAKDRKDYDWAHLARRYWPSRVDQKCRVDPSLGVAHGCFWRYHPARAWAWELRLQDELGPDTRITEAPPADDGGDKAHRSAFLREQPALAIAAIEKEAVRRMGRAKGRQLVHQLPLLEAGLWTAHPAELWALELRLSEKQGAELRITAPDEPEARAAYAAAQPAVVAERRALLAGLVPQAGLFGGGVEEAGEGEGDDEDGVVDGDLDEGGE